MLKRSQFPPTTKTDNLRGNIEGFLSFQAGLDHMTHDPHVGPLCPATLCSQSDGRAEGEYSAAAKMTHVSVTCQ